MWEKKLVLIWRKDIDCECLERIVMHPSYEKHPRLSTNRVINSLEFSLFLLLYFLNLSFSPFFSRVSFSLNAFLCYIPWFLHHSHHKCANQVLRASPCPISYLFEPSTISCKVACLLFRHHLHINAARGLVGKHLMWGQQPL